MTSRTQPGFDRSPRSDDAEERPGPEGIHSPPSDARERPPIPEEDVYAAYAAQWFEGTESRNPMPPIEVGGSGACAGRLAMWVRRRGGKPTLLGPQLSAQLDWNDCGVAPGLAAQLVARIAADAA
jgi:hypothetical protein